MGKINEEKFAKEKVEEIEEFFKNGIHTRCDLLIDKNIYKRHNFEELKKELNKLNYDIIPLEQAPDYARMPLRDKLYIYKK